MEDKLNRPRFMSRIKYSADLFSAEIRSFDFIKRKPKRH